MKKAEQEQIWFQKAAARLKGNQPLKAFFNRAKSKSKAKISFNEIVNASQGNFAFAQFLVRALIKNPQRFKEDLPQAEHYLKILKQKKVEQKHGLPDITKLNEISELAKLCEAFEEATETTHVVTPERQSYINSGEARILKVGKKFTAVLIKSARAAVAFEGGRLWCTSYTKSPNHFYQYAAEGAVIDLIDNETGIAAYGIAPFSGHCNDSYNEDISVEKILKEDPEIAEIFYLYLNHIDQKPEALAYIPENLRTSEACAVAVKNDPNALSYVPEELRTNEMCLITAERDPYKLGYVPEELVTQDLCKNIVSKHGYLLNRIPPEMLTQEICLAAVANYGDSLRHVPEEWRTEDMCKAAVADDLSALKYVPREYHTEELYASAKMYGGGLMHLPKKWRTNDLYTQGVLRNGHALRSVPRKLRSYELCTAAVTESGFALQYVPGELRTEELCIIAVKQYGRALKYVPRKLWTEDICAAAAAQHAEVLDDMPQKYITAKVLFSVFQNLHYRRKEKNERLPLPALKYHGLDDFIKRIGIEFDEDGFMHWDNFTGTLEDFEKQFPPKRAKSNAELILAP